MCMNEFLGLCVQRRTPRSGTAALPADGGTDGIARNAVPQHNRLSLICNTDAREIIARKARAGIEDIRRFEVDLICVLFYPSGVRKALPHFLLRAKHKLFFR